MTHDATVEQLLRWRLARAEADAPPAPRAARLIALARPWWELWPERLQSRLDRLNGLPAAYGYAMVSAEHGRRGHPVPALIVDREDIESYAWVLYLSVRDGRLRLRFQLDGLAGRATEALEVTFVPDTPGEPLIVAHATLAQSGEYRVDVDLPETLERSWGSLKVTDRMPFRLILRPIPAHG